MTDAFRYITAVAIFTLIFAATGGMATNQGPTERVSPEKHQAVQAKKVRSFYMQKNPRLWESLAHELAVATVQAAARYKIPLEIQVGVNTCESEAHPFARSRTGAKGLGQVDFDAWSEELGRGNPYEPHYNQNGTSFVLATAIRKYGLKGGLEVYNLGEGNYLQGRRNKRYVRKVFAAASEFRRFGGG